MTFEEMKKIVVDTLNCEEDKVTMEASLTEDLEADSLDAVELNMALEDAWVCPSRTRSWQSSRPWGHLQLHHRTYLRKHAMMISEICSPTGCGSALSS